MILTMDIIMTLGVIMSAATAIMMPMAVMAHCIRNCMLSWNVSGALQLTRKCLRTDAYDSHLYKEIQRATVEFYGNSLSRL